MVNYFFYKGSQYTPDSNLSGVSPSYLPKRNSINTSVFFSILSNSFFFKKLNGFDDRKKLWNLCSWYTSRLFNVSRKTDDKRVAIKLIFKDMVHLYKTWRHVRGYPSNGQRTWSNGKSVSKNNTVLRDYRATQIISAFGKKRRKQATNLVLGEYNNKLWKYTWFSEWDQARKFNIRTSKVVGKKRVIKVDLVSLTKCITGGYRRKGSAAKFNKAKKRFRAVTIGLPVFFTRYIYLELRSRSFPVPITLLQVQRKMKSSTKRFIKKKATGGKKNDKKKTSTKNK